jgi:hypothetical protein
MADRATGAVGCLGLEPEFPAVVSQREVSMGATGWSYYVPYQTDLGRALDELRRDVLTRGDYEEPGVELDFLDEAGFFGADEASRDRMMAEYGLGPLRWAIDRFGIDGLRGWLESQQWSPELRGPRPRSMEELEALRSVSSGGTHSILDIGAVRTGPASGAIYPLPEGMLRSLFGTDQLTRGMVEAWRGRDDPARYDIYDRWQGVYFAVYRDGRPDEIYIEGASGD